MMRHSLRHQWSSSIRGDLLSGVVGALALIPEAIAFSIIARVAPKMGLYASFYIAVVIAFVGGRPGMVGWAMISQSVINVKSGGRSRHSTFAEGIRLLMSVLLGKSMAQLPMAAMFFATKVAWVITAVGEGHRPQRGGHYHRG